MSDRGQRRGRRLEHEEGVALATEHRRLQQQQIKHHRDEQQQQHPAQRDKRRQPEQGQQLQTCKRFKQQQKEQRDERPRYEQREERLSRYDQREERLSRYDQREERLPRYEQREERLSRYDQREERLSRYEQREERLSRYEQREERLPRYDQREERLSRYDQREERLPRYDGPAFSRSQEKPSTPQNLLLTQPSIQPSSPPQPAPSEALTPQAQTSQGAVKPDRPSQIKTVPPKSSKGVLKPPRRPDAGGKSGRRIDLRVNFLPFKLTTEDIHHYHSDIKEKGKKSEEGFTKSDRPKILQKAQEMYDKDNPEGPKWVYDKNGTNIYCSKKIPGFESGRQYTVQFTTDNGKEKTFIVDIKWVAYCSLYELNKALEGRHTEIPYDTLQAIEVVIQQMPKMRTIQVRSSFFDYPSGRERDLGGGIQVWNGTFLSIRPTQWKMMLNVDTSSTGFYKPQPVIDFMCEFLNLRNLPRSLDARQRMKFAKEIKAIKVETTHVKRKQKAGGLTDRSAREETFDCDGRKVTVLDYFKNTYNISLRHPDLPCVKIGQKGSLIPMELCHVVSGQKKQGKLTGRQTQQMIRSTTIPAPDRMQKIMELIRKLRFEQDPYLHDFGFSIGNKLIGIQGRVLDPPSMMFGPINRPSHEMRRDDAWKITKKMLVPKELREWALISYKKRQPGRGRGPDHLDNQDPCHVSLETDLNGIDKLFGRLKARYPNLQLIVVVLPVDGDDFYEEVKHCGDVVHGIITQCIKVEKASDDFSDWRKKETLVNLWLKMNAKLGGTTCALDKAMKSPILKRPVIIFGADVTHPGAGNKSSPSIAAVVASKDSYPTLYNAEVRVQKHRQEMIEDLKEMTKELLKKFRQSTKAIPEKILFYRDGVSRGQFQDVLIKELSAIQRACLELQAGWTPAITFIVVQKRHHAKFFATDPKDQKGKSRNIPAGTVVDTQICHPYEFNFYLCSHAGIQGTSKPALYHVLYDDSNFTSDDLQILTNQLCYTYVRCTRSVSIPAPAYYAHHVAFRARHHLKLDSATERSTISDDEPREVTTEQRNLVKVHPNVNCSMYFA
ncbi:protein argonaute-2-like isoform X2 [Xenia sp. Carnegie-2017]|uniref:protein argonaute-2-like isoform X2 n=1 Tax=Xenia sp. Carnegie-2017 TaxID=2897299 RepID=UPI001F035667|nr:protein argonaute-2-like isoform X2 [Xenia sp. Carnegie-2017]